ncbi:10050_t:CDS:10, partial [Acaulospora morrowiae]
VLCVAEKPSIAKSVAQILSSGQPTIVREMLTYYKNFTTLVILTENSKIQRFTGSKYVRNYDFSCKLRGNQSVRVTMTAVLGHLLSSDFSSEYKLWDKVSPLTLFEAPIVKFVTKDNEVVRKNIMTEARSSVEVMIWTDCDREGENIGAEIVEICRESNPSIKVTRAKFSAVIPQQIHHAWQTPTDLDYRQSNAVDARMELDLRVGAAFTRSQTLALRNLFPELSNNVISYGPCQFPTLGFVVDQYFKVQNFVAETFWKIYVALEKDGDVVEFNWERRCLFDRLTCLVIYEQCVENPLATVVKVTSKEVKKWKPCPLTTVELLKVGSRSLHIASDRVMSIAENLYNKGYISYPRTETDQFNKQFDFNALIKEQEKDLQWGDFAKKLLDGGFCWPRNGKHDDFAHPPIHPTTYTSDLSGDDKKIYEFIVRRFLACCADNAIGNETSVEIKIWEETFTVKGLVVLARNYLDVYPYDKWNECNLPNFQQNETFIPTICEMREGYTTPPECLTEADLISIMDQNGIGTDATIHEHIAKIIERDYAKKEQRGGKTYIVPLKLGIALVEGYDSIGFDLSLSKPFLRREMESSLKLVCEGRQQKEDVVRNSLTKYKDMFIKTNQNAEKLIKVISKYLQIVDEINLEVFRNMLLEDHPEPTRPIRKCFNCARQLIIKSKQNGGWMIGCQGYPHCNAGIKVSEAVSNIVVSSDRCDRCSQTPGSLCFKLKAKFVKSKIPSWIPEEYLGCVGGCDDFFNEYFTPIKSNPVKRMPLSSLNQNSQTS